MAQCISDAMETTAEYTLDDLCTLTELPKRTVRYYMQLGLVDRPEGETRAARYGARHLEQLLAIRKWQRAGLSLERIRELLAEPDQAAPPLRPRGAGTVEVWSHLVLADGVELHIEPARAGLSPEQLRRLLHETTQLLERIKGEQQ